MLHMIKHDLSVLQTPYKLHLCDEVDSIPIIVYQHFENEIFLSMNLFSEVALLDVVILILGLQLKYYNNIATC
jgi:hypothetical protein